MKAVVGDLTVVVDLESQLRNSELIFCIPIEGCEPEIEKRGSKRVRIESEESQKILQRLWSKSQKRDTFGEKNRIFQLEFTPLNCGVD